MRRLTPSLLTALAAMVVVAAPPPARACFFPPPSRVRSVLPLDGAAGVPTNARPRVSYSTGPQAESKCGNKPAAPKLVRAAPDGGAPAGEVTGTWTLTTDHDPRDATVWELRPDAALAPRTTYQLLDTQPETCDCTRAPICPDGPLTVFATFTTGDGPDETKPIFGGILDALCTHAVCGAGDQNCCGPYDHMTLRLQPQLNAADDNLVGIRWYVRKDGAAYDFNHPVGPGEVNDPVDSTYTTRWDIPLTAGTWHVMARAFDLAGNEDDNLVEATFSIPLVKDPICAKALIDGGIPVPDFAFPPLPDGTSMYPRDMSGFVVEGGACGCVVGGGRRGAGEEAGAGFVVIAIGALLLRPRGRLR